MEQTPVNPKTREESLALEIAEKLGDQKNAPFYLKMAETYSEHRIREVLEKVERVPEERIRVSRGALFNWLIHNE